MPSIAGRLNYLRKAEAFFAIGLPAVTIHLWNQEAPPVAWELRIYAMTLVSYLLVQGALYWHFKYRDVMSRGGFPPYFAALFRAFKWSNVMLLAAGAAWLAWAASHGASAPDLKWAGALLAFALLEHINYYAYQLMYDTAGAWASLRRNRRLRRPALALDMQK